MAAKKKSIRKSSSPKRAAVRAQAALAIQQVHSEGKSLSDVLASYSSGLTAEQQPFFSELCYGSLRWFIRLEAVLTQLMDKPLRHKDRSVFYLLVVGLYQLNHTHKPDYAVVQETVTDLKALKREWAKGLVNAILRRFIREREELLAQVDQSLHQQYAHPQWLVKRIRNDWESLLQQQGREVAEILTAANAYPPFWIRVNSQQSELKSYTQQLTRMDWEYDVLDEKHGAILLSQAQPVELLPGFNQGMVSVQDGAAQMAASLLDLQPGQRVLDVCAAPGGKTAHILETCPQIDSLLALDISAERLSRVDENLKRIGLSAELKAADAVKPQSWWDEKPFQRILLDAPCSATGVIRRHPDIKVLRRAEDISALVTLQYEILEQIWNTLAVDGILVYATCSIVRDENDRQIARFLSEHQDALEIKFQLPVGRAVSKGWQILTGESNLDGFYYAVLRKTAIEKPPSESAESCKNSS